jgi:threonine aldolase
VGLMGPLFCCARSRVVAVENTHNKQNGCALPLSFMEEIGKLCRAQDLIFHVDGARLMNATVALKVPGAELCKSADSISLCLSKGLGAPIGAVTLGSKRESQGFWSWASHMGVIAY